MIEQGNKFVSSDFLRVLQALKENICIEINVADVCTVNSVQGQDEYICQSLSDDSRICAISIDPNDIINVGDMVVVLYCNNDFRMNLKRIKSGLISQSIESTARHSKAFGVIIKVISI